MLLLKNIFNQRLYITILLHSPDPSYWVSVIWTYVSSLLLIVTDSYCDKFMQTCTNNNSAWFFPHLPQTVMVLLNHEWSNLQNVPVTSVNVTWIHVPFMFKEMLFKQHWPSKVISCISAWLSRSEISHYLIQQKEIGKTLSWWISVPYL